MLRDLFVRGKYRDVILPMFVLRRLDAVLEPTQKLVLETKEMLDKAGITEQRAALCRAASQAFKPLRKNLGKKNCELSPEDIERICESFMVFKETEQSKIFPNEAIGYRKITVERPLRLQSQITLKVIEDHNWFRDKVEAALKKLNLKLSGPEMKVFLKAVSCRVETAPPVIAKIHKVGKAKVDLLHGLYANPVGDKELVLECEHDPDLRDTEQVPLQDDVETFLKREVLPYTPDAWFDPSATKIGYEISFTRHFYKPPQLRSLAEISADILALEQETEGLLSEITKGVTA